MAPVETRAPARLSAVLLAVVALSMVGLPAARAAVAAQPPAWQTDGTVHVVQQAGDVVFVAGAFSFVRPRAGAPGVRRWNAAAFDAATGDLLPWAPVVNGKIRSLLVSADGGTVFLGGSFTSVGGMPRERLAAVTGGAGVVLPWRVAASATVLALALSPDGRTLYVGGHFARLGGEPRRRLGAVSAISGAPVNWSPWLGRDPDTRCSEDCSPIVSALALSPDGSRLYAGGNFDYLNGKPRRALAAFSTANLALLPWQGKIAAGYSLVRRIIPQGGVVYVCGYLRRPDRGHYGAVALAARTGARITAFDIRTDGGVETCAVSDRHLFLGGHFLKVNNTERLYLAAVALADGALSAWNPKLVGWPGVWAISVAGATVDVGGDFARVGGVAQRGFARLPSPD